MGNNLWLLMRILHACVKFTANLGIILLLLVFLGVRRIIFDIPVFLIDRIIYELKKLIFRVLRMSRRSF